MKLAELIRPDGACPIHELDLDTSMPFSARPSAPYRMDLAITYRCNNDCAHCYNVEHPTLTPGPSPSGRGGRVSRGADGWYGGDAVKYHPGIIEQLLVPEPKDDEPLGLHPSVARAVLLLPPCVRLAIELQHQSLLVAVEIHDVGADLMLTPELQAHEAPVSDEFPEQLFRRRPLRA